MKGIELTKEQIEAYNNGATILLFPIDDERIKGMHCHGFALGSVWFSNNKDDKPLELINGYKNGIRIESPLAISDEFFIQEEFTLDEILLGGEEILYKQDFAPRDFQNSPIGYGLTTDKMKERILERCDWQEASQMQEHQARYKDTALNVEVKRVQDISVLELIMMGINTDENSILYSFEGSKYKNPETVLKLMLEKQGIKYQDNPYVFVVTINGVSND